MVMRSSNDKFDWVIVDINGMNKEFIRNGKILGSRN